MNTISPSPQSPAVEPPATAPAAKPAAPTVAPTVAPTASANARVIAIGRAGMEMALALRDAGIPGLSFAVVDADAAAVQAASFEHKQFVGARLTRGFGAGGDPELARAAADDEIQALRALCQGNSLILLVAGLGGGSGTGITPVVARVARETGASVFAFVTAPFECEGSRREQQALVGLHRLKTVADGVLCLPNEKMLHLTDDRTTLVDAFRASASHIRDAVICVWSLLTRPGLINVSLADICSVLRGPNLESAFARVEVEGPDRAEQALRRLLEHPLLARGEILRRAESLLVSFHAGSSLGMGETRRIMEELNARSDGARVVVGASVDEAVGERLTVTVIASTRHIVLHEAPEAPAMERAPRPVSAPLTAAAAAAATTSSATAGAERDPSRSGRHLAPPPPELSSEQAGELLIQASGRGRGTRRKAQQVPLPFEVNAKGRFEKCEPTVRRGHNLDQPTYLRRGVPLN